MKITIDSSAFEQSALSTISKLDKRSPEIIQGSAEILFRETQVLAPRKSGSLLASGDIKSTSDEQMSSSEVSYGEKDVFNTQSNAWVSDYLYKVVNEHPDGNFFENAFINTADEIMSKIDKEVGAIIIE